MALTPATIPGDISAGEVKMADFRCSKCDNNLGVNHSGAAQAMQGLARCNCGAWTPFKEQGNLFRVTDEVSMPVRVCPKCKAKTAFKRRWEWPPDSNEVSALDQCSACGFVAYFKSADREGRDVTEQYPIVVVEPPAELPDPVKKAYAEALKCHGAGAPNGSLLMCRRAVQEALDNLGAKGRDLPTQLEYLVDNHKITPDLKEWADNARIGGRLAAHGTGGAEWGDPTKVWGDKEDAEVVIAFCDAFFEYVYVIPERNKQRRGRTLPAAQSGQSSSVP